MTTRPVVIYALVDPRTEEVRYIGKTNNIAARLCAHFTELGSAARRAWMNELWEEGLLPEPVPLDVVAPGDDWGDREREWIRRMRARGEPLLNRTNGGEGARRAPGYHRRRLGQLLRAMAPDRGRRRARG
jgi:hypothetical protein